MNVEGINLVEAHMRIDDNYFQKNDWHSGTSCLCLMTIIS